MNELDWLIGARLQSLIRREHDWLFAFDNEKTLVVECLWRLVEAGRIRITSEDDGHAFALPQPVNAAAELNGRLAGTTVDGVNLRQGLLDLEIRFSTGHVVQIIPTSAGYEAWTLGGNGCLFVAVGGGELTIFRPKAIGE